MLFTTLLFSRYCFEILQMQGTSRGSGSNPQIPNGVRTTNEDEGIYMAESHTIASLETNSPIESSSHTNPNAASNSNTKKENAHYDTDVYRLLSYPDSMEWETKRLLSKSGFIYMDTNIVQCHYCNLVVNLVLVTDVDTKHRSKNPNCPIFNKGCKDNIELLEMIQDLYLEAHRIMSFLRACPPWPKMGQPNGPYYVGALELAKSGFFYAGTSDTTRCYFCRLEITGWEKGDTAETEHRKWNPHCVLITGMTNENVPLGKEFDRQKGVIDYDCTSSTIKYNVVTLQGGKSPQYSLKLDRIKSFSAWPKSMKQHANELSAAGFYYTGRGDRVMCYHCGGGLKDWSQTDNPWIEHAIWFPNCQYLIKCVGEEFINKYRKLVDVQSKDKTVREDEDLSMNGPVPSTSKLDILDSGEIPMKRLCKICLDNELGIIFLPCAHMSSCPKCAPQLSECPVCRVAPTAMIRAYLP